LSFANCITPKIECYAVNSTLNIITKSQTGKAFPFYKKLKDKKKIDMQRKQAIHDIADSYELKNFNHDKTNALKDK
jgi:hypothetical protein